MVLEKMEHDWEQIRLSNLGAYYFGDFMHRVGKRSSNLPAIIGHHKIVHLFQLFGPIGWSESLENSWEIIGAVIDDVVINFKVWLQPSHI